MRAAVVLIAASALAGCKIDLTTPEKSFRASYKEIACAQGEARFSGELDLSSFLQLKGDIVDLAKSMNTKDRYCLMKACQDFLAGTMRPELPEECKTDSEATTGEGS